MRVLHVLDHSLPVQSGYSFRSQAILRQQRQLGWETVQITSPKQGVSAAAIETIEGMEFHRVAPPRSWLDSLPVLDQLATIRVLRRELRAVVHSTQPDIIQAHSPCLNALAALGLGKPLVYEMRSSWEDAAVSSGTTAEGSMRYVLSRALETHVLRRADAITTICEGLRDEVRGRGIPAQRITVVPNAVDVEELRAATTAAADLRQELGLYGKFVLGFIGSFFAWEGLVLLVEALAEVVKARPDARLLLVGSGIDEPAIRAAIARLGLQPYVLFTGQLPHHRVRSAYDAIDVLVYPRLSSRLTEMVTPLKPLEAMALGKVMVASNVGGHRELIADGVTGVLFRAGNARALAESIVQVASSDALRAALAGAGPQFVERERTWAKVVPRYQSVYQGLLSTTVGAVRGVQR